MVSNPASCCHSQAFDVPTPLLTWAMCSKTRTQRHYKAANNRCYCLRFSCACVLKTLRFKTLPFRVTTFSLKKREKRHSTLRFWRLWAKPQRVYLRFAMWKLQLRGSTDQGLRSGKLRSLNTAILCLCLEGHSGLGQL